ncbi:MAG TPA: histidine phosphatase family protein [Methylomirabilota bacterium]|nr:histidine phosphatase family protein [Methylomirabilota bacterium]
MAAVPALIAGVTALVMVATPAPAAPAAADEALWRLLAGGGQVVLLRHATTEPGIGDPPGFRLDDCATQRNLAEAGRAEARRIGAAFAARRIPVERVLSSPWCRCLETARLAFGSGEPWEPSRSLFADRTRQAEQAGAFRALAGEKRTGGNLVLVTHGASIVAFVGVSPPMGGPVIVTPQGGTRFTVAGRLPPPS